jgi:hypothetical protein
MTYIIICLLVAAAIFGLAAAWFWFRSAKVITPKQFNIMVVKPSMGPLGGPLGGTFEGMGYSQELTDIGQALIRQSNLSGYAAIFTVVSVILTTISAILAALPKAPT